MSIVSHLLWGLLCAFMSFVVSVVVCRISIGYYTKRIDASLRQGMEEAKATRQRAQLEKEEVMHEMSQTMDQLSETMKNMSTAMEQIGQDRPSRIRK